MFANATLTNSAQQLLEQLSDQIPPTCDIAGVAHLIPHLIELLDGQYNQPVDELESTVRSLILEQTFIHDGGDHIVDAAQKARIDHQVMLLIRILNLMRDDANESHQWSDAPVTPQMFG